MEHVVALHGFAGTGRSWGGVAAQLDAARFTLHTPDLPGHGNASSVRPITFARCVQHVLDTAPERFALCGYSLGGRIALYLALAAPERVTRLVMVSTTAGIDDDRERALRRREDEQLADVVARESIEQFVERWTALPLFAATPADALDVWRDDIRRNDPVALAAALRGIGGGAMVPLWGRLAELTLPVTVVAGSRDEKYVALGERLVAGLPAAASLVVIDGGGHGLPREAPDEIAAAITAGGRGASSG